MKHPSPPPRNRDLAPTARSLLLIHPPVAKPCEPPAGLAKLAFALRTRGIDCRIYDASIDGLLGLLEQPSTAADTWSRRAIAHRQANLAALRTATLYHHRDRYRRAVMDLNRALAAAAAPFQATVSLANFTMGKLSPVRSQDLLQAAERFADNPFYPCFAHRLKRLFLEREPDIVGFSINFMSQALCAFAMIGFVRRQLPRATVVCGGGLVTSWLRIPGMGNPFAGLVDEMVAGPGEARLMELCRGGPGEAPAIAGYDFAHDDGARYLSPVPILPYTTSRGCYWRRCAFCPETAEGNGYVTDDPQRVLADLKEMTRQTSAGLIHFLDNALSPRLMTRLAEQPPGPPWYGFARITAHLADRDLVHDLATAGCRMLKLGVESGDPAVLEAMDKGIALDTVVKALHTLHQAGIATYVYLLFGTPAEDETSAQRTLAFTLTHAGAIDFLNLAIFNLPAHGQGRNGLETLDFYPGDLSLYREFIHPRGWDRSRVRRFLATTFSKPAAIRTILHRDPPFFTSNHAPFFTRPR